MDRAYAKHQLFSLSRMHTLALHSNSFLTFFKPMTVYEIYLRSYLQKHSVAKRSSDSRDTYR